MLSYLWSLFDLVGVRTLLNPLLCFRIMIAIIFILLRCFLYEVENPIREPNNYCYFQLHQRSLRKHAYSNILKNFTTKKKEKFSDKNSDIFHISAQNIDCGYSLELPRRGGSNEYPQSMFLSRNKKNNVYPCKPQFYYIKVGFKGGQHYIGSFA